MNLFLTLAFLFFIGSVTGWVIELLFRRFFSSSNPERRWINPGFCTGPYLPLYGCGLCLLYLIARLEEFSLIRDPVWNRIALFAVMALCMTVIEYIAGIASLKIAKVRLWDYTKEWGNIQGIICPKFSLVWAGLGALDWLSQNLAFSFVVGLFFGFFIVDVVHSSQIVVKLKRYAEENRVVVRYEAVKADIRRRYDKTKARYPFFRPFRSDKPLAEHLKDRKSVAEEIKKENTEVKVSTGLDKGEGRMIK